MFGVLVLLFLVVPIIELYIIVQVASGMGIMETIGLLILISIVGAWLVRAQGLAVLGRVQGQLAMGNVPGKELVDGLLILLAGALMLTPGFMTDAFGLLLLMPPTRAVVRTVLIHRYRDRMGPIGMLLSIPLTMAVKAGLEIGDATRPIAVLLGPPPKE